MNRDQLAEIASDYVDACTSTTPTPAAAGDLLLAQDGVEPGDEEIVASVIEELVAAREGDHDED